MLLLCEEGDWRVCQTGVFKDFIRMSLVEVGVRLQFDKWNGSGWTEFNRALVKLIDWNRVDCSFSQGSYEVALKEKGLIPKKSVMYKAVECLMAEVDKALEEIE